MNNIVFDFRHNYERGERLGSQEVVYQYDEGRVIEAYVPEQEGFVLNVGFETPYEPEGEPVAFLFGKPVLFYCFKLLQCDWHSRWHCGSNAISLQCSISKCSNHVLLPEGGA